MPNIVYRKYRLSQIPFIADIVYPINIFAEFEKCISTDFTLVTYYPVFNLSYEMKIDNLNYSIEILILSVTTYFERQSHETIMVYTTLWIYLCLTATCKILICSSSHNNRNHGIVEIKQVFLRKPICHKVSAIIKIGYSYNQFIC